MIKNKQITSTAIEKPVYLNGYYRLKKSSNKPWWIKPNIDKQSDKRLLEGIRNLSLLKIMHSENIFLQKTKEVDGTASIRIAIKRNNEQRFIGVFRNDTECSVLFIKHKTYAELFVSEKIKNNSFAFYQMLEAGELESEIAYHRAKHVIDNGE
ncbi:MAG TPA: hypothetical protein VK718_07805 [Ferruginibacter sp.]|jgi:hypothetical protein|nr:hypothetical protein [Ferruginibacter sp.]